MRTLGLSLSLGYILFYFGERVFWSFPRQDDSLLVYLLTWCIYAVAAYVLLHIMHRYHVRGWWSLFIAGALVGWLIEGLYALTFFGVGGLPFPITVSWTGLAWHALIDVWFGVFGVLFLLTTNNGKKLIAASIGLGVFWGVWSLAWALETPPMVVTSDIFFLHALITTALLVVAYHGFLALSPGTYIPSKIGAAIVAVPIVFYSIFITIPTAGVLFLTLVVCIGVSVTALRKTAVFAHVGSELSRYSAKPRAVSYVPFVLTPLIASLIYNSGIALRTNLVIMVVTTILGTVLFIVALKKTFGTRTGT